MFAKYYLIDLEKCLHKCVTSVELKVSLFMKFVDYRPRCTSVMDIRMWK